MKRLSDQTLYEILEVSVEAAPEEIERAYERARALYGPGSLATYTLMSSDESTLLNNRIEEARLVLLDAAARIRYDERIGVRPRATPAMTPPPVQGPATPWPAPAPPAVTPVPEAAVASSTGLVGPEVPPPGPAPIALQTPIATPPPGTLLAVELPGTAPAAGPAEPSAPTSPGAFALTPSPVAPPGASLPPIPLRQEVAFPRELLVPEGAAWSGEMLRQVRESRGLTVPQISERTKVTRHHLENIEGDRFQALPAPVYLRGILLSLARELRLDGQRVARSYLERMAADLAANPPRR